MSGVAFDETKTHYFGAAEGDSAVDRLVLSTVNAPYKRTITAATLQECILTSRLDEWTVHIATFFTDVSPNLVLGFASAHGISKSKLAEVYLAMKTKTGERNPDLEAELAPVATSAR
jgi:hypothetical protein